MELNVVFAISASMLITWHTLDACCIS